MYGVYIPFISQSIRWLDSLATFELLAPLLVSNLDVCFLAMDFSGHGRSSQLAKTAYYTTSDRVFEVSFRLAFSFSCFVLR
jgi:hypothetical protein